MMRIKNMHVAIIVGSILAIFLISSYSFQDSRDFGADDTTDDTTIGFGVGNMTFILPSKGVNATPVPDAVPEVRFVDRGTPIGGIKPVAKPMNDLPMLMAVVLLLATYCIALYANRDLSISEIRGMYINHQR